ncbi:hypothetical protein GCM10012280_26920 [Wenjunlia tyrosinilytica]|uniref:Uncharacterized protein n=1 Tax=Wenjunlia tyrosinilytica TaxID=1544741 RepID=A0A917ZN43_9ACTN|nr:hypothetical protein GCM10012280_26920 [Wenjunlia tyrosinilytica]
MPTAVPAVPAVEVPRCDRPGRPNPATLLCRPGHLRRSGDLRRSGRLGLVAPEVGAR